VRRRFQGYFLLATIFYSFGILLAFFVPMITLNYSSFNRTEILISIYQNYSERIPALSNSIFSIYFDNFILGILIMICPIAILLAPTLIGKVNSSDLRILFVFSKNIALILSIISAFRTFSKQDLYIYFVIMPINIFLVSFIHAIFEIPAFILSFTFSLILIDDIYDITSNYIAHKKSKTQIKKVIGKLIVFLAIIAFMLLIAAYMEAKITPYEIINGLKNYFQLNNIPIPK
jgi:uncharacterized membrane protein SpoIIM required for sporulation